MPKKGRSPDSLLRRRRARVYQLRLRGFQVAEIQQLVSKDPEFGFGGVSLRTIVYDLAICKAEGLDFNIHNTRLQDRMKNHLYDELNAGFDLRHEAWLKFYAAKNDVELALKSLMVIDRISFHIQKMLGITGITLRDVDIQERIEELARQDQEISAALRIKRTGVEGMGPFK